MAAKLVRKLASVLPANASDSSMNEIQTPLTSLCSIGLCAPGSGAEGGAVVVTGVIVVAGGVVVIDGVVIIAGAEVVPGVVVVTAGVTVVTGVVVISSVVVVSGAVVVVNGTSPVSGGGGSSASYAGISMPSKPWAFKSCIISCEFTESSEHAVNKNDKIIKKDSKTFKRTLHLRTHE